jgi:uncharacterized protein (TIGR00303 family)
LIKVYTQIEPGLKWLHTFRGKRPVFACILGFTETGLIPGISAAGATPQDRQFTALADAEFLINGPTRSPRYPLPPLQAGASPVLITRAVVAGCHIPVNVFNAGLPLSVPVPAIDLHGQPAQCVSTGNAMDRVRVHQLFQQGQTWGHHLALQAQRQGQSYVILAECVVGGTTTALAVLTGLGIPANGKINSSHPTCNHGQKWQIVQQGLQAAGLLNLSEAGVDPMQLVAAVGDPMQVVVAGMTLAASQTGGVLLAGGTQMLAVYALCDRIAQLQGVAWNPQQVVVGTTRWVAEDPSGDTIALARLIGQHPDALAMPCLMASQLNFAQSHYPTLRAYEQGYVKEGVGAGACAMAANLSQDWSPELLLTAIEDLAAQIELFRR